MYNFKEYLLPFNACGEFAVNEFRDTLAQPYTALTEKALATCQSIFYSVISAPILALKMRNAPLSKLPLSSYVKSSSSFAGQSCARISSLLPFLYQTRTLLLELKTARHEFADNGHNGRRRKFCSTSQGNAPAENVQRSKTHSNGFVNPRHKQVLDNLLYTGSQWQSESSPPSTVTATEQAVFNRLIKEIPQRMDLDADIGDILDQDEYGPNADINAIFEAAIKKMVGPDEHPFSSMRGQQATNALIPDGAPAPGFKGLLFRRPLKFPTDAPQRYKGMTVKRPLQWVDTSFENEDKTDEERATLEVACDDHRTMLMGMLDNTNSDLEVWRVLENEVFSLITQLDEHNKLVGKASNGQSLDAAKARKAGAEGKDIADVKLEKGDLTPGETKLLKLSFTKAIPINNLLIILNRNYAEYCLSALRLFRHNYPTSSYATHVFATMKARGPISYVLGVSSEIYNEVIFLKWTQHSDLHAVADLLEEMLNQGVEGNYVTVTLIKGIAQQRRSGMREYMGPVVKEWWHMRGNLDGWRRVCSLYKRMGSEMAERRAKRADEMRSEDVE